MDFLGKPLVHTWTDQQRLDLCLIKAFYSVSNADTTAIFNRIHKVDLAAAGHINGLRTTTLQTMLYDLRYRRALLEPYRTLSSLSLSRLRHKYWQRKNKIEDTAFELGLELQLKAKEDHRGGSLMKRLSKARQRSSSREETSSSAFSLVSDTDESPCRNKLPPRPRLKASRQTPASAHKILPLFHSVRSDGTPGQRRPIFLFRAFNEKHGFMSRDHLQHPSNRGGQPPSYDSDGFREIVKRHLMIDEDFVSPFISLTQFPKAAVKYLNGREDCSLAVFEFNALEADAIKRFPGEKIPYLVPSICSDHNIDDLPGRYTGFGEWLAYGSVEAIPLATWPFIDAHAINTLLESMESISFEGGRKLGKHFQTVPVHWRATLAFRFLCSYKVDGYEAGRGSRKLDSFLRGLHEAAAESAIPSILGSTAAVDSNIHDDIDEIIRYSSSTARTRHILEDSDDNLPMSERATYKSFSRSTAGSLQAFKDMIKHFRASESGLRATISQAKHDEETVTTPKGATSTQGTKAVNTRQIIDLTNDIHENGENDEDVIFQSARRVSMYKRALSIRSSGSTNYGT